MRGVYSCGKTTRARELAGDTGKVLEVDAYFEVETDEGIEYEYRKADISRARKHVYRELKRAMKEGISPIVIDRDNGPSPYSKKLMTRVVMSGYTPKLAEPTSSTWKELRAMLENREKVEIRSFAEIAEKLAKLSRDTHRVSRERIFGVLMTWPVNVTIEDFLNFDETAYYRAQSIYEMNGIAKK
jgi:hypothetical protein